MCVVGDGDVDLTVLQGGCGNYSARDQHTFLARKDRRRVLRQEPESGDSLLHGDLMLLDQTNVSDYVHLFQTKIKNYMKKGDPSVVFLLVRSMKNVRPTDHQENERRRDEQLPWR